MKHYSKIINDCRECPSCSRVEYREGSGVVPREYYCEEIGKELFDLDAIGEGELYIYPMCPLNECETPVSA